MPTAFDPLKIKNITLSSRIVRSATAERIAMRDEREGEILGQIYADLVSGGMGLVVSGHIAVHPRGRLHVSMPMIHGAINAAPWRTALSLAHKAGGMVFFQLNHGGGRCRAENGCDPVCVSYLPGRPHDAMLGRELTDKDIGELIAAYAAAARNARDLARTASRSRSSWFLVSQFLCH
jgi:N-ethylmaleimide reductase